MNVGWLPRFFFCDVFRMIVWIRSSLHKSKSTFLSRDMFTSQYTDSYWKPLRAPRSAGEPLSCKAMGFAQGGLHMLKLGLALQHCREFYENLSFPKVAGVIQNGRKASIFPWQVVCDKAALWALDCSLQLYNRFYNNGHKNWKCWFSSWRYLWQLGWPTFRGWHVIVCRFRPWTGTICFSDI